jgi:cell division protein FtsL
MIRKKFNQAFPQAPWRSQIQLLGLFLLFLVTVAVVAVFYLNVTARAVEAGRDIQVMQATISALEYENASLQSDLANQYSYEVMKDRAERMGFEMGSTEEKDFLVVEGYTGPETPKLASTGRPVLAPDESDLPAEFYESVFTWLQRVLAERAFANEEIEP